MTVLAADIGGTSIKLGIVEQGRVIARDRVEVVDHSRLAPMLPVMTARWEALLSEAGRRPEDAVGVALAFAGVVEPRSCRVVATNDKFVDAPSLDLAAWADRTLRLPIRIDNDARAALIGEWRAGAGRGVDDLVMLTLGTGIGAAAVVDGRVVRGSHGMAGVFGGHLTVELHGRRCTCGNIGCAEAEASTHRLKEVIAATAQAHGLKDTLSDHDRVDYAHVFAQAGKGDPLATAVRDRSIAVWSAATVNLIHAYGPRRVVLGGGVTRGSPWIIEAIQQYVDRHAWTPWGRVDVRQGELGDDAALIGCGSLHDEEPGQRC